MVVGTEGQTWVVGDRVQVGEDRGTVLFVGAVGEAQGLWLGIDWDDPSRGRHDGSFKGVSYFKARYDKSGSLVRPEKVAPGLTAVEAVQERYGVGDVQLDEETLHQIEKATNAPFLRLVGFDKVASKQRYSLLKIVCLREMRVTQAGESDCLGQMCPNIEELDLGRNLLNSWHSVSLITQQCPKMTLLDLSENRLNYDGNLEDLRCAFTSLEFLVLSKMEYTWQDVLKCSVMWPHIEKLQVSHNRISLLEAPPIDTLRNLKLLNIQGNNIVDWSEVLKLGILEKLEVFNVSNNGLTRVSFPTPNNLFPALKFILLSGNLITSWESVNELNKLNCLEELKFQKCPVLSGLSALTARQMLVARVVNLKILNGQQIESDERRGAEYDYMKQNAKLWWQSKNNPDDMKSFVEMNPRYPDLVKRYGEIEEAEIKPVSMALKNRLVTVNIRHGDRELKKSLPLTMTVQKVAKLISRFFNTDVRNTRLIVISSRNPTVRVPLEDDLKEIDFYSIENGDLLIVET